LEAYERDVEKRRDERAERLVRLRFVRSAMRREHNEDADDMSE
jgi:hypothetical protein